MSVRIIYRCNGCERETSVLAHRSEKVVGQAVIGGVLCDRVARQRPRVEDFAPEGWVAYDPYTSMTYCPFCWAKIESGEPQVTSLDFEGLLTGERLAQAVDIARMRQARRVRRRVRRRTRRFRDAEREARKAVSA